MQMSQNDEKLLHPTWILSVQKAITTRCSINDHFYKKVQVEKARNRTCLSFLELIINQLIKLFLSALIEIMIGLIPSVSRQTQMQYEEHKWHDSGWKGKRTTLPAFKPRDRE